MSVVLDNALNLARQNVRLFPVVPNSKLPLVKEFSQKASADSNQLHVFFGTTNYNSGIACGKYSDDLYLVGFDIDNKPGKDGYGTLELLAELGEEFPKTWSQRTPSGGEHRLFWSPIPIRQGTNVLGQGIDLRGEGGYLVGPGSSLDSVHYLPLCDLPIAPFPAWAVEKYQRLATVHPLAAAGKMKGAPASNQSLAVEQTIAYLQSQPPVKEGGRSNECFRIAARIKDFGLDQKDVLPLLTQHWQCEPMLEIEELNFTIGNAYRYSKNPAGVAAPENLFTTAVDEVEKTPIQKLNENFFYYAADGVSRVCEETTRDGRFHLERYPVDKFHEKFAADTMLHNGKEAKITKVWMEHKLRRTYKYLRFKPTNVNVDTESYNTWRGFQVKTHGTGHFEIDPRGTKAVNMFLDHCKRNICGGNEQHAKWLIGFMAHIFQKPEEKPEVSLVFQGKKGTGKTIVSTILGDLIGDHAVILANRQHVLGHFNSIMEDKLLVTLDEAFWSGDKSVEGTLKDIITGNDRVITHKGAEPYKAKVYDRIVIIGNEERLVPATADERRFAVFMVGNENRRDRKFFGEIKRGLKDHGGLELLMQFFMTLDISDVDVHCAPETEGLNFQKEHSQDALDQWWVHCLQDGRVAGSGLEEWPLAMTCADLYQSFMNQLSNDGYKGYRPNRISFALKFKTIAPSCKHARLKNARAIFLPPLDLARSEWDDHMGYTGAWD